MGCSPQAPGPALFSKLALKHVLLAGIQAYEELAEAQGWPQ